MKSYLAAAAGAALFVLAGAQPSMAQNEALEEEALTFAINNSLYVLYHEIGHLLIGELGIPVLGKEEDAADNLAALLLLVEETDEADRALIDSSDGWFASDILSQNQAYEDAEFYGEHSLDLQRAFRIVCMMVGSNADVFGDVADTAGLDPERQESCQLDYEQALVSWTSVLEPHEKAEANMDQVEVIYEDTADYSAVQELLRESEIMEYAAEQVVAAYELPRKVNLVARECGEANAFYDPELGEISLCYELVDSFYAMFHAAFGPEAPKS